MRRKPSPHVLLGGQREDIIRWPRVNLKPFVVEKLEHVVVGSKQYWLTVFAAVDKARAKDRNLRFIRLMDPEAAKELVDVITEQRKETEVFVERLCDQQRVPPSQVWEHRGGYFFARPLMASYSRNRRELNTSFTQESFTVGGCTVNFIGYKGRGVHRMLTRLSLGALWRLYLQRRDNSAVERALVSKQSEIKDYLARSDYKEGVPFTELKLMNNAELRRVLVEAVGIKDLPEPIQQDDFGKLYRLDQRTNVVRVVCPSTDRVYFLGVPSACESAAEAVRWTFPALEQVGADQIEWLAQA